MLTVVSDLINTTNQSCRFW